MADLNVCILIETDSMRFLKATESVKQAEYWVEILAPQSGYYIGGLRKRHFSVFTWYDLAKLYENTTGDTVPTDMPYNKLLTGCKQLAENVEITTTPIAELREKLGLEIDVEYWQKRIVHAKPEKLTPQKQKQLGTAPPARPKAGSTTGRVWEIAEGRPGESRAAIIQACIDAGINASTASTQYSKWRRWSEEK